MLGKRRERFRLEPHEVTSPLWLRLKEYMELRLETARRKNDKDNDERRTARLRGSIAELKHLVTLDQPAPQQEPDDLFD